jgi:hypothetical protein
MATENDFQNNVTPGQSNADNNFIRHPAEEPNLRNLNDEELQLLIMMAINTLRNRGVSFPMSVPAAPKVPDIFDNAKFEQIACNGLQPKYNGSPEELIPTSNVIHIRRQNEVWYAATFMMQDNESIDLVQHFSKVSQATIQDKAKELWDHPDSWSLRLTRGTPTYNSRLLALFLMNSLTPEFAALLHS